MRTEQTSIPFWISRRRSIVTSFPVVTSLPVVTLSCRKMTFCKASLWQIVSFNSLAWRLVLSKLLLLLLSLLMLLLFLEFVTISVSKFFTKCIVLFSHCDAFGDAVTPKLLGSPFKQAKDFFPKVCRFVDLASKVTNWYLYSQILLTSLFLFIARGSIETRWWNWKLQFRKFPDPEPREDGGQAESMRSPRVRKFAPCRSDTLKRHSRTKQDRF